MIATLEARTVRPLCALFRRTIITAMLMAVAVGGCASTADYDPTIRRERLLAMYPPVQTSRKDVQKRWQGVAPELTALRPAGGWAALDEPRVREHVAASEQRVGKPVRRVDRYFGADGMFGLCYCWFYYDEDDNVLDAEWQHHSD